MIEDLKVRLKRVYLKTKSRMLPHVRSLPVVSEADGKPARSGRLPLRDGRLLDVVIDDPTDHLQRLWAQGQWYEIEMLRRSGDYVGPNSRVIDIGACIGNHSLYWAHVCGAEVVAFEPQPRNADLFRRNAEGSSITIHQVALGLEEKQVGMVQEWQQSWGSFTVVEGSDVQMARLDDFTADLERIDLIKIDVEDLELQVIVGARDTLATFHPTLLIEIKEKKQFEIIDSLLTAFGYSWTGESFNATPTYLWTASAESDD